MVSDNYEEISDLTSFLFKDILSRTTGISSAPHLYPKWLFNNCQQISEFQLRIGFCWTVFKLTFFSCEAKQLLTSNVHRFCFRLGLRRNPTSKRCRTTERNIPFPTRSVRRFYFHLGLRINPNSKRLRTIVKKYLI